MGLGRSCLPIYSNFPRRIVQEMKDQRYVIRRVRRKDSSFSGPLLDVELQLLGRTILWIQGGNKRTIVILLAEMGIEWREPLDATITVAGANLFCDERDTLVIP